MLTTAVQNVQELAIIPQDLAIETLHIVEHSALSNLIVNSELQKGYNRKLLGATNNCQF